MRTRLTSVVLPIALLVAGLVVGVLVVHLQTYSATGLLDLRVYLGAARFHREGLSIYDFVHPSYQLGSTYPPLWSLVLVPVSPANVHLVEYAWTFVNLTLWWFTLSALFQGVRMNGLGQGAGVSRSRLVPAVSLVWFLTLFSAPVWNTLNQGQINILVWFLIVTDLRLVATGRKQAGVLSGIATALKLVPGVVVLFLAVARQWRPVIRAVAAAAGLTVLAAALAYNDSRRYWTVLLFDTSRIGGIDDAQNNSLRAVLQHLGLSGVAESVTWIVAGVMIFCTGASAVTRGLERGSIISVATVIGAVSALVSPISWTHHLLFLCFPLLLVVRTNRPWWQTALWLGLAEVVLVDPVGFGRMTATSVIRCGLLIMLVVGGRQLVAFEAKDAAIDDPSVRTRRGSAVR